jgi:hypothetical protein
MAAVFMRSVPSPACGEKVRMRGWAIRRRQQIALFEAKGVTGVSPEFWNSGNSGILASAEWG